MRNRTRDGELQHVLDKLTGHAKQIIDPRCEVTFDVFWDECWSDEEPGHWGVEFVLVCPPDLVHASDSGTHKDFFDRYSEFQRTYVSEFGHQVRANTHLSLSGFDRPLVEKDEPTWAADGFDEAVLGLVQPMNSPPRVVYDREACIGILQRDGMTYEEAEEFFSFNTEGAWVGPGTPLYLARMSREEIDAALSEIA